MRVAVYADLVYRRAGDSVSSQTPFVLWLGGLAEQVGELVVVGRLDDTPPAQSHTSVGNAVEFELAGRNASFVALPYYPSLRDVRSVMRGVLPASAIWKRASSSCDVALLFGPHPYALAFALVSRRAGTPVVVGVRQDFPEYLRARSGGWRAPLASALARSLEVAHSQASRCGAAIVVDESLARRYRRRRSRVLTTGMSLVRSSELTELTDVLARPWPGPCTILVVGRLDPEKNPMLLVELAAQLSEVPPWRLRVAGGGAMLGDVAAAVEQRSLEPTIDLVGRLDREGLREEYRNASVFCHVSRTEGQPQVLFEAAAYGLPIVATAVGGVPSALAHGKRGLLVPPDSAGAIVGAIDKLGADPARRMAMTVAAWRWASDETLEAQTGRVRNFLAEVASTERSRPPRTAWRRR